MKQNEFFDINDALCFALYKSHRLMNALYRKHLAKIGLTYSQFLVMICLWNKDGQTPKELGDELSLDFGTLSPLIKRLVLAGHVEKLRSNNDERKVYVNLTEKGKNLKKEATCIPGEMFNDLGLEMDEFLQIRGALQRFNKNLEAGMQ